MYIHILMDFPYFRKSRNWWFLPFNLFTQEQEKDKASKTLRSSPVLAYLDEISNKDKFKYILITLVVILLLYRLNLSGTIWIGLLIGLVIVYYFNEQNAQTLNSSADQNWSILKGPLLKHTKYFVTDPPFIQLINDVAEFKQYNILEFNKFVSTLDKLLKLMYNMKLGLRQCRENLDLIRDLKINSLNQFHSLIYSIHQADMRDKANHYFKRLGYLLNERMNSLTKICQQYYIMKPVDIESSFDIVGMDDPAPIDQSYERNYNFYN